MNDRLLFERNLLALASTDPELCRRLSASHTTRGRYRFLTAREGSTVPAIVDRGGAARPLHSLVDPRKEAVRLTSTVRGESYIVLFGLGGAYVAQAAIERQDIHGILAIEFDLDGIAELFAAVDFVSVLGNPRFRLLVDPSEQEIREVLFGSFRPAFSGGISMLPLRPRIDAQPEKFARASGIIKEAIDSISDDYSVQAYFGKRWFANAIRNIRSADKPVSPTPPIRTAAITAAGPSLDMQLNEIGSRRSEFFLLATDTSLPTLLNAGIKPDAVISIDCQHISYYHFMGGIPDSIPLFLDLASPPVVASRTTAPRFFSGGHPLTVYISRIWRSFPRVDTSGGNVTYAAVAMAAQLGADKIELYGADFSYPNGVSYSRGSYIYPHFRGIQTRLQPIESLFSAFIFRNEPLKLERNGDHWRYETKPLVGYRERLERLAEHIDARVVSSDGAGAPIRLPQRKGKRSEPFPLFACGSASCSAIDFLKQYASAIRSLPPMSDSLSAYTARLSSEERDVMMTMLPSAATIRRRDAASPSRFIFEELKDYCLTELDRVITAPI